MRISAQETVTDAMLCNIGPGGPEWLMQHVPYKLAHQLACEIVKQYKGSIVREGNFNRGCTSFTLGLLVFSDAELKEFVAYHIKQAQESKG